MMMCKEASEYEQQSDHAPSEKEQKYDRQLRLWASSGQQALESAHLVLFNSLSGIVAIETLKNIVLPGTLPYWAYWYSFEKFTNVLHRYWPIHDFGRGIDY